MHKDRKFPAKAQIFAGKVEIKVCSRVDLGLQRYNIKLRIPNWRERFFEKMKDQPKTNPVAGSSGARGAMGGAR